MEFSPQHLVVCTIAVFAFLCILFAVHYTRHHGSNDLFEPHFRKDENGVVTMEFYGFGATEENRIKRFKRVYFEGKVVSYEGLNYTIDSVSAATGSTGKIVCVLKKL